MVPSAVEQLEEALNQRELAEEKFKAKMKEVVKKLKEETIQLAELRLQQRPPKQPKRQIDLNVEDTSDLENLFGLDRFNLLKTALAPVVVGVIEPYYREQFLPELQRTGRLVAGLDKPMCASIIKKIIAECIREFAGSGLDYPTELLEWAATWRSKIESKVERECQLLREKTGPTGRPRPSIGD
ncbi:hypothetical protein AB3S75_012464 [Citrus x aurantiifolia]